MVGSLALTYPATSSFSIWTVHPDCPILLLIIPLPGRIEYLEVLLLLSETHSEDLKWKQNYFIIISFIFYNQNKPGATAIYI